MSAAQVSLRRLSKLAIVVVLAGSIEPAVSADMKPGLQRLTPAPLTIEARRIEHFRKSGVAATNFGKLTFRGGLQLTAPAQPSFGGWSGIIVDDKARDFFAVSDAGAWLMGTIRYEGKTPVGVDGARIGPLRKRDGSVLSRSRDRDAEAVALVSGTPHRGRVQVAFERNARIAVYDVTRDGVSPTIKLLQKPAETPRIGSNSGFEAMTIPPGGPLAGRTVLMAERFVNDDGHHTGWIYTASGPRPFYMTDIGGFDITAMSSIDDGTVFVLERRFRWLEGVKMRIRRLGARSIVPGAVLEGDVLIEADMAFEIDNMEGLAATREADGTVLLTVISDDNFNTVLQRTLLLQFALPPAS